MFMFIGAPGKLHRITAVICSMCWIFFLWSWWAFNFSWCTCIHVCKAVWEYVALCNVNGCLHNNVQRWEKVFAGQLSLIRQKQPGQLVAGFDGETQVEGVDALHSAKPEQCRYISDRTIRRKIRFKIKRIARHEMCHFKMILGKKGKGFRQEAFYW